MPPTPRHVKTPCHVKTNVLWYHVTTSPQSPRNRPLPPVHVIGATGRTGQALCRALIANGQGCVPIVRNPPKFSALGLPVDPVGADVHDPVALATALHDATSIALTVHARETARVLAAAPPTARLVVLGSTRRFSPLPGEHGLGVLAGEQALLASARDAVMLHSTMIYGGAADGNLRRMAAFLARLPVVPLPGGGRSLVQPIHHEDVTAALLAALARPWPTPTAMVIAGPAPLAYAELVREVAAAAGLRRRWIIPVPAAPLIACARWAARHPGLPQADPDEIRRMLEDKAFDIADMITILGIRPIPLQEGLARAFGPAQKRR